MAEYLRLARLYVLLLAIVTVGRWLQGTLLQVPYAEGTDRFSIVILTLYATLLYAAFSRVWLDYPIVKAMGLAMTLALIGQLVVLLSTVVSYALGVSTYFNHPRALNQDGPVSFGLAMGIRAGGLIVNVLLSGISGALGWTLGGLLPKLPKRIS
jgi:hypothetical protein